MQKVKLNQENIKAAAPASAHLSKHSLCVCVLYTCVCTCVCVCKKQPFQLPGLTKAHVRLCGFVWYDTDTDSPRLSLHLPHFQLLFHSISPSLPLSLSPFLYIACSLRAAQPLRLKLIAKCKLKALRPSPFSVLPACLTVGNVSASCVACVMDSLGGASKQWFRQSN